LHYQKYCGTPPVHLIVGLARALDLIFEQTLETIFGRHRALASAVHAAVEAWSIGGVIGFNVEQPAERAPSVTTILMNGRDPEAIRRLCHEQCNVILGHGVGELARTSFLSSGSEITTLPAAQEAQCRDCSSNALALLENVQLCNMLPTIQQWFPRIDDVLLRKMHQHYFPHRKK
jgi:hypothetical protein